MNRYYALLGLAETPSLPDLKAAYHRLAKRNHPDLFPDVERRRQQLKMMRINEAYMLVMSEVVGDRGEARPQTAETPPQAADPADHGAIGTPRDPASS